MSIRRDTLTEVIGMIRKYGEINMQICGDNILIDPCLRGQGFSPDNIAISDHCSTLSTIHSSKYHACQELIAQIEALALKDEPA
jgi:hypothetical protein